MNLCILFTIEDITNIILPQLDNHLINIQCVSKYFESLFTKFIHNKCKNIYYTIDINKFELVNGIIKKHSDDKLIIMAKYVYYRKYFSENETYIIIFILNHIILQLFHNIYKIEYKNTKSKISKLKTKLKQNNKRQSRTPKYANNNNINTLTKIKNYAQYKEEIRTEMFRHKKHINNNFELLLIENNTNTNTTGIIKLVHLLKDITILDLRNIQNKKVITYLNILPVYFNNPFHHECRDIFRELKKELTQEQYDKLYNGIINKKNF